MVGRKKGVTVGAREAEQSVKGSTGMAMAEAEISRGGRLSPPKDTSEPGRRGRVEVPDAALVGLERFLRATKVISDFIPGSDQRGYYPLMRIFLFIAVQSARLDGREPVTHAMIAKALDYSTTNVSRFVQTLSVGTLDHHAPRDDRDRAKPQAGLGWVTSSPYLYDRRQVDLRLTPKGDQVMLSFMRALLGPVGELEGELAAG